MATDQIIKTVVEIDGVEWWGEEHEPPMPGLLPSTRSKTLEDQACPQCGQPLVLYNAEEGTCGIYCPACHSERRAEMPQTEVDMEVLMAQMQQMALRRGLYIGAQASYDAPWQLMRPPGLVLAREACLEKLLAALDKEPHLPDEEYERIVELGGGG